MSAVAFIRRALRVRLTHRVATVPAPAPSGAALTGAELSAAENVVTWAQVDAYQAECVSSLVSASAYSMAEFRAFKSLVLLGDAGLADAFSRDERLAAARAMEALRRGDSPYLLGAIMNHPVLTVAVRSLVRHAERYGL